MSDEITCSSCGRTMNPGALARVRPARVVVRCVCGTMIVPGHATHPVAHPDYERDLRVRTR